VGRIVRVVTDSQLNVPKREVHVVVADLLRACPEIDPRLTQVGRTGWGSSDDSHLFGADLSDAEARSQFRDGHAVHCSLRWSLGFLRERGATCSSTSASRPSPSPL